MKIRIGFVSNSSSSSFVIRGIEISAKKLAQVLSEKDPKAWAKANKESAKWRRSIEEDEVGEKKESAQDLVDIITSYSFQGMKKSDKFEVEPVVDFFDESAQVPSKFIIGIQLVDLEDGLIVKLPKPDDKKAQEVIERLTGLKPEKLETYIQFVSNDNY